jgi:DNA-binding FadR family transcriptional regulator
MKKAVLHATSAGLEALKRVYQRMDRPNIKVDDFVALDAKFHLSIAHLTH